MSKTELLYNKILKISLIVAIVSFILLIIDLFFAVVNQAIDCSGTICKVETSETFFQTTIYMLAVIAAVSFITARVMLFILTKENKLEDASAYKLRINEQEHSSDFSESMLYDDIKQKRIVNKPRKESKILYTMGEGIDYVGIMKSLPGKAKDTSKTVAEKTKDLFDTTKEKLGVYLEKRSEQREIAKALKLKRIEEKKAADLLKQEELAKEQAIRDKELAKEQAIKEKELAKQQAIKEKELAKEQARMAKEQAAKDKAERIAKEKEEKESIKQAALIAATNKELEKKEAVETDNESVEEIVQVISLNKTALIAGVALSTGLTKIKARLVVNTFINTIINELSDENEVSISKFGKFKRVFNKASVEVNPKTGKKTNVPENYDVKFLPDKAFKDMFIETAKPVVEKIVKSKEVKKEEPKKVEKAKEKPVKKEVIKEEPKKEVIKEQPKIEVIKEKPIAKEEKVVEVPKVVKKAKPKDIKKTKADIIECIENDTGISKNKSNKFLKFFAEIVKEELSKGKDVNIKGFGVFTTIKMPAKDAVNPQTNKKIIVPAHNQARLRFDDEFKKKF